jgi:hypothetical protein
MKTKTRMDTSLFMAIRWFGFIGATIVSAYLNLYLINGLDASRNWLMCAISLTLEMTKVSSLISGNIFNEMYHVLKYDSLRLKKRLFYGFYGMFAVFSIFCSLAFSITVTDKKNVMETAEGLRLSGAITVVQDKLNEIEAVKQLARSDIMSHPDYVAAQSEVEKYQVLFDDIDDLDTQLSAKLKGLVIDDPNRDLIQRQYDENRTLRSGYQSQLRSKIASLNVQKSRLTDIKNDSSEELAKLNGELEALKEQYELTTPNPLIELKSMAAEHERLMLENAGSEKMFIILSDMFSATPKWLKFFILLFLSVLIEITVYQTGPDIRITPRILRYFKKALPRNVNITKIIKTFEQEYNQFDDELVKIEVSSSPTSPPPSQIIEADEPPKIIEKTPAPKKRKKSTTTKKLPKKEKIKQSVEQQPLVEQQEQQPEPLIGEPESIGTQSQIIESAQQSVPKFLNEVTPIIDKTVSHQYRFGKSSEKIKDRFVDFVKSCINKKGSFIMDPAEASILVRISDKLRDEFLSRLNILNINGTPLAQKDLNTWIANFDAKTIIDFSTEILEES